MSQKMNRRTLIKNGAVGIVGSTVALAGCSGGSSGPEVTREVDAPEGEVELSGWSEEITEINGQQAFVVTFEAKNVSDRDYYLEATAKFYDGDDTMLGDDLTLLPGGEQLPQGESIQGQLGTFSSPGEVRRYVFTANPGV